jgi:iron complex transport system substrate-binding protein
VKKLSSILAAVLSLSLLCGCGAAAKTAAPAVSASAAGAFTDALGYEVSVSSHDRVVSLYGSFAEAWMLSGGTLAGATQDAVDERNLDLGEGVSIVGTVKEPNLEEILALSPDFVILSSEIPAQVKLHQSLTDAGIPHAYFSGETFDEYLSMLKIFCGMTGRDDLYQQNGEAVKTQIGAVLKTVSDAGETPPKVLLLRAYSSGCKAKGSDSVAGAILKDLGAVNIADSEKSLLDDVSMEAIIAADPDYIFVVPMGSESSAETWLDENFKSNPAWAELTAVKSGNYAMLPKELFHYKPNAKWGESYEYLAKLLYPSLADKLA